ncbi:MAG: ABC transporter ATP-binding protein [Pseudomonadota bacterium]
MTAAAQSASRALDVRPDPHPGDAAAIEIRGLRKIYGATDGADAKRALNDIDLAVPTGAIFGLLGPNGAGKSTLINILAGLVVKTAGSVRIWGFDQDVNPRMSRASIGVVPQELNVDPFLSPAEALEIQAGLYGVPKSERRTLELLEALGLADKAKANARSLSGGMKRRLLVAKAMVHSPPVLVLDEPTAGVDIELRRQLWSFVRELNAGGATIILTTHYLEEAQEMCDRIAIIHRGEVRAEAPTDQLLARIDRKTLVIETDGPIEDLEPIRRGLPAEVSLERRAGARLALSYPKRCAALAPILAVLSETGVAVRDMTTEEPDLEDVFLELTGDDGPDAAP